MQNLEPVTDEKYCVNCNRELLNFYTPSEDRIDGYCPNIDCCFSTNYSYDFWTAYNNYKYQHENLGTFKFTDGSTVETNTKVYTKPSKSKPKSKTYTLSLENIVGFADLKDLLRNSVNSARPTHILLCSPPSVSKTYLLTSMLNELNDQGATTLFVDCSSSSSSGIAELLQNNPDVDFIVFDEVDSMRKIDQKSLLLLLQNGKYRITKSHRNVEIILSHTKTYFTCNRLDRLIDPLLSRVVVINLPNYTKDQFYEVSIKLLNCKYGLDNDIAHYITDQVFNLIKPSYIRNVEKVVKLLGNEPTYSSIDKIVNTLIKYNYREKKLYT